MLDQELNSLQEIEALKESVTQLLAKHKVPFESWGRGTAKTLNHLIKEIAERETLLEELPPGELFRKIGINLIDVFHETHEKQKLRLVEDKQIFKDGRQRIRKLGASLSEKLKASEQPSLEAVQRALAEELGISSDLQVASGEPSEETVESPSYPGLMTKTQIYHCSVWLTAEQYKPEGYVEHQSDKDTYFVWKPADFSKNQS